MKKTFAFLIFICVCINGVLAEQRNFKRIDNSDQFNGDANFVMAFMYNNSTWSALKSDNSTSASIQSVYAPRTSANIYAMTSSSGSVLTLDDSDATQQLYIWHKTGNWNAATVTGYHGYLYCNSKTLATNPSTTKIYTWRFQPASYGNHYWVLVQDNPAVSGYSYVRWDNGTTGNVTLSNSTSGYSSGGVGLNMYIFREVYKITYNGGDYVTIGNAAVEAPFTGGITLPNPSNVSLTDAQYSDFIDLNSFLGWSTVKDNANYIVGTNGQNYVPTKNETLYAIYRHQHALTTLYAGTNGTCSSPVIIGDFIEHLPSCTPNSGFRFLGWATTPDAVSPQYLPNESFTPTDGAVLYAVYVLNEYWVPITHKDELQNDDEVVIGIESGLTSAPSVYAVSCVTSSQYVTSVDVTSKVDANHILTLPTEAMIMKTVKVGDNLNFYYYDSSSEQDYYYPGYNNSPDQKFVPVTHGASYTNSYFQLSWWYSSNHPCLQTFYAGDGKTYVLQNYEKKGAPRVWYATSYFDQIAQRKELAQYASALSIFKKYYTYSIIINSGEGTTTQQDAYCMIPSLAPATKDGYNFVGWTDDGGNTIYHVGDRYPKYGCVETNTTLTAVYSEFTPKEEYIPITSFDDLQDGDQVIFVLEDGGNGNARYALSYDESSISINTNFGTDYDNGIISNACVFTLERGMRTWTEDSKTFFLKKSSKYLYIKGSSSLAGIDIPASYSATYETRLDSLDEEGHVQIGGNNNATISTITGYYYLNYSGSSYGVAQTVLNQHATRQNIANATNPAAWTVYKHVIHNKVTFTFANGAHGTCDISSAQDYQVTLPAVTCDAGWSCVGWHVNGKIYPVGSTFYSDVDVTLTAQYEKISAHFDLNRHGIWKDDESRTKKDILLTFDQATSKYVVNFNEVPLVYSDHSYRFLGWSTDKYAISPQFERTDKAQITQTEGSVTYYAIYGAAPIIWASISDPQEIMKDSAYVVGVCGGNPAIQECRAFNYNSSSALDMSSYLYYGILVNVPSSTIVKSATDGTTEGTFYFKDGNSTYKFGHNGTSYANAGNVTWATSNTNGWSRSWNAETKTMSLSCSWSYYGTYKYAGFYLNASTMNWYQTSSSSGGTNQIANKMSLTEAGNPEALTIFKKVEDVNLIHLDPAGGTCSAGLLGYGVIESLPAATPARTEETFYGWTDGVNVFKTGERYPTTGFVTREDVTLKAIYSIANVSYSVVTSVAQLTTKDDIIVSIQDGNVGGTTMYSLSLTGGQISWQSMSLSNMDSHSLLVEEINNNTIVLQSQDGYYLNYTRWFPASSGKTKSNPYWIIEDLNDGQNHVRLYNQNTSSYHFGLTYNPDGGAAVTKEPGDGINQHVQGISLANAASQGLYPHALTIYRKSVEYSFPVTFNALDKGTCTSETLVGSNLQSITLPDILTVHDEYVFLGWFDGNDTLAAGSEYFPPMSKELTAVYERKQAYFNLQGHGTWVEDSSADTKTIIGVKNGDNYEVTVPALNTVTPDYGYRFLGWAMDKDAKLPTYTGGEILKVNVPQTLYAVYSAAYVFRLISSTNELHDDDEVILVVESGAQPYEAKALGSVGASADITTHMSRHILTLTEYAPFKFNVVVNDNGTFSFTYQDVNYKRWLSYNYLSYNHTCAVTHSTSQDTYSKFTISRNATSKRYSMYASYYLVYGGGFFGSYNPEDQMAQRIALKTTGASDYTNTGSGAISIMKKFPLHILSYEVLGGTCDCTFEYGGSESLPEATPSDPNKDFVGWTDGTRVYKAGTRFPETGAITEDMTLTAVFKESQHRYEKITKEQIRVGDIIMLTLEDGDGNPNPIIYSLSNIGQSVSLDNTKPINFINDNVTADNLFEVTAWESDYITLYNQESQYYIAANGGSYHPIIGTFLTPEDNNRSMLVNYTGGGYYFRSSYSGDQYGKRNVLYSPESSEHLNNTTTTNAYNNQFVQKLSLADAAGKGWNPGAWTIYRQTTTYAWTYTFSEGEGDAAKGVLKDSERVKEGISITLPTADAFESMQDGWSLRGWTDGVEEYKPGSAYSGQKDTRLTAVYEPYTAHFVVNTTMAAAIDDKTGSFVMPAAVPNSGYRFLGWATTEGGEVDNTYAPGTNITLDKSCYFYAVCEELQTCAYYTRSSISEIANGDKCLLAFEDGDGGPNRYALYLESDDVELTTLDSINPSANLIFTYNGSNNFTDNANRRFCWTRNGGGWTNFTTSGQAYDNFYETSNGCFNIHMHSSYNSTGYHYLRWSGPTSCGLSSSASAYDQWSYKKSLADAREAGYYPTSISVYQQHVSYAYYINYVTAPATDVIATEEVCATNLPDASAFSGSYASAFIGWATTAEKATNRTVDYLPGAYYNPTQDITLYAVFAYIPEYTVLEWSANSVTIETAEPVTAFQTQVGDKSETDAAYVDKNIYQLSTPDLSNAAGQTLTITFEGQDVTIGSVCITIPTIVTSDVSSTSLSLTNTSDIVVLNNAKLTMAEEETVNNVTIMGGGKLVVPENVMLIANHIYLKGGHASATNYQTYEYVYPQLAVKGELHVKSDTIFYDYLLNKKQQYTFAVPMPVKRSDIKAANGEDVTFKVAEYDGAVRAQGGNGWGYTDASTFEPGKGYTIFATPLKVTNPAGKLVSQYYVTVRMPMVIIDGTYSENESRSIQVTEYPSDINPTLSSWNLVGVPFMCNYSGTLTINDQTQEYVTIPDDKGTSYINYETDDDETILPAFKNFFVQAAATGSLVFDNANRQTSAPWRRMENLSDTYRTGIILSQGDLSDRVGLLLGDIYTDEYEINADWDKWMNAELSAYAIVGGNNLAYAAIDHDMAAKEIPIGYKTTQAGACTFSLNSKYDASLVQAVWLTDYETGDVTNLLWDEYVFTTKATTDNTRFALTIIPAQRQTPTDINQTQFQRHGDCFDILGRRVAPNQRRSDNIYIQDNHKFIQH